MKSDNIYLFAPNLVGYLRIILCVIAFALSVEPIIFLACYTIAFFLDDLDGYLARRFNQRSKFGYLLDIKTDLVATAGLLTVLALLYPDYMVYCICLMGLNFFSHGFLVFSSVLTEKLSHKDTTTNQSWATRIYYGNAIIFWVLWAAQDVFYLCLYALFYYPNHPFFLYLAYLTFIPFVLKQIVNVFQLKDSMGWIVAYDKEERARKRVS